MEYMNDIVRFVENHGYVILFAVILARQAGLPLPGFLFLIAAGALSAAGKLCLLTVIALAVGACLLADMAWYEAGRSRGDEVLHFLHRFTRDPDFHNRRSKRIFARYGLLLLVVAKFVPGLDAIAPPMAGVSRASRLRFLGFDTAGSGLYASLYGGSGYVFSHDLDRAATWVSHAGGLLAGLALGGICIYTVCNLARQRRRLRNSQDMQMANVPVECGVCPTTPCGIFGEQENGE